TAATRGGSPRPARRSRCNGRFPRVWHRAKRRSSRRAREPSTPRPRTMSHERLRQAVRNNALWCDTVCRTHGSPGEFLDGMWINRRPTPRFYPNAVTLSKDDKPSRHLARIHDLVDARIPGEWGVKDSFCALDLAALGFRILFEADWVW